MLGAGIAVQSMITTLKNNSRKKPRKKFFNRENRLDIRKRKNLIYSKEKELSQKDKLSIQKKIKNQRQKEKFLNFIVFIIAIILAIILYPIIAAPFLNVL
tara:strand:+ start:179 stop:478 length:300 start_codon:yes stop_codon:yes gene_type:complete